MLICLQFLYHQTLSLTTYFSSSDFSPSCTICCSTLVRKECAKNGIEFVDSVFTMSEVGIGEQLVALATVGAVLWAIFLIVAVRAVGY